MADGSRFELEPAGEATVVRVLMPAWEDAYDEIREGWTSFVMQLRFALERHPGEDRRTLERHPGEDRRTLELTGGGAAPLDPNALGGPGDRYDAETAWGERWSGELLYRTENQAGLIVDGYGPGLVILHFKPGGGGMAIVTTYGFDDDAFAQLERRWRENY